MSESRKTVLVVGATGSIRRLVVEEAVRQGYVVRALVRTPSKARKFPAQIEVVSGDVYAPRNADCCGQRYRCHRVHARLGRGWKSGG
jgi:putative NADH-flavin reductase